MARPFGETISTPGALSGSIANGTSSSTVLPKASCPLSVSEVPEDSVPVPFRVVSPTEMVVTIDESLLRRAGRFPIVVKNLGPSANPDWGDGTSNKAWLLVNYKY